MLFFFSFFLRKRYFISKDMDCIMEHSANKNIFTSSKPWLMPSDSPPSKWTAGYGAHVVSISTTSRLKVLPGLLPLYEFLMGTISFICSVVKRPVLWSMIMISSLKKVTFITSYVRQYFHKFSDLILLTY